MVNSCSLDLDIEEDPSGVGSSSGNSGSSETNSSGNSSSSSGISGSGSSSSGDPSGNSSSDGSSSPGGSSSGGSSSVSQSSSSVSGTVSSSSVAIIYGGDIFDTRDGKTYRTVVIGTQVWMAENLSFGGSGGNVGVCYGTDGILKIDGPDGTGTIDHRYTDEEILEYCTQYGRLYDWETVMASAASSDKVPSEVKGICPDGWHVPSDKEWEMLALYVGSEYCITAGCDPNNPDLTAMYAGTRLKAKNGWRANDYYGDGTDIRDGNGTDNFGFSALAGGFCFNCLNAQLHLQGEAYYRGTNEYGYWWTATEYRNQHNNDNSEAYRRRMKFNENTVSRETQKKTGHLSSVRCVMD